jgi:Plasmid pRiA4b ORF-3-like protein
MRDGNPIETWLSYEDLSSPELLSRVQAWLDAVASEVEQPKPKYSYSGFRHFPIKLSPALRERAEALFPRVWHAPGTLKHDTELALLSLVGATADPASIPFWKQTIAWSRARDTIAAERREVAAAALAYTALRHPASGALAALSALTKDEHVDARVGAVDTLAFLAANEEAVGALAQEAAKILERVAADERAFAPHFLARRFLVRGGAPLPAYEHGNAIAFEVTFAKVRRTIELAADQTLADLHLAILDAFGWDTDHLHQFSLSGDLRDERFSIPAPDEETPPFYGLEPTGQMEEPPEEESFPLGAMGLPVGHAFAYLYDFGDNNIFRIKVTDIHAKVPRTRYPRVTAKVGKDPAQYPSW